MTQESFIQEITELGLLLKYNFVSQIKYQITANSYYKFNHRTVIVYLYVGYDKVNIHLLAPYQHHKELSFSDALLLLKQSLHLI